MCFRNGSLTRHGKAIHPLGFLVSRANAFRPNNKAKERRLTRKQIVVRARSIQSAALVILFSALLLCSGRFRHLDRAGTLASPPRQRAHPFNVAHCMLNNPTSLLGLSLIFVVPVPWMPTSHSTTVVLAGPAKQRNLPVRRGVSGEFIPLERLFPGQGATTAFLEASRGGGGGGGNNNNGNYHRQDGVSSEGY